MNRRPIRDHGAANLRNIWSYHLGLAIFRSANRVTIAVPRGIPRKTATLLATVEYPISSVPSSLLMTLMKSRARGAYSTTWRIELIATRIAQYSLSPPARPVQMRTWMYT